MGRHNRRFDFATALTIVLLGMFGLFVLLTVGTDVFWQQLVFFVVSLALMFGLTLLDPVILAWFSPIGYLLMDVFLAMSYLGPNIRGATRWLIIGPVRLQPSELMKPVAILAFSYLIARYPPRKAGYMLFHVALFLVPFLLVFKQPDLGSSIVYAAMWLGMMVAGGLPLGVLAGSVGVGVLGVPIVWNLLHDYQRSRILTFLNPALDPRGEGYNAIQAMIAVGSGQLFGRGLGLGTQSHLRFLPEYHTDFVFATLVEELGFIGGFFLLLGYAFLLWRVIAPLVKREVVEPFPYVYSIGLFTMILTQVTVNSGMNMGLLPITGITLPLVSYGGSSLLSIAISFGFLWVLQRVSNQTRSIAIR